MLNVLEVIYPNICGFCGKVSKENICPKCKYEIKKYEANITLKNEYFENGVSIYNYKDIIRKKIIDYKFQNKPYLYKTFGEIILKNKKICGIFEKYDIIIPVPTHKKRKNKRGYSQTELIAKYISKRTGIVFGKDVLNKIKNNVSQTEVNKTEKAQNVKNAFTINNIEKIKGKKVILFDDVYTTGSTVNECSRVIKKANVKDIFVLTIAKY